MPSLTVSNSSTAIPASSVPAATGSTPVNADVATAISGQQLRAAASHFPTGVAIVTSLDQSGDPVGCTISSFLSVSLEPPIVAVSLQRSASTLNHIIGSQRFGISVLASRQRAIAQVFAHRDASHADRFSSVSWREGKTGVPILEDGLSSLECHVHEVVPAGDHYLILGSVQHLFAAGWGTPLVHHQGTMGSLNR